MTSQWEPAPSHWEGCDFPLGRLRLPTGKSQTSNWEGCDFPVGISQIPLGNPTGSFSGGEWDFQRSSKPLRCAFRITHATFMRAPTEGSHLHHSFLHALSRRALYYEIETTAFAWMLSSFRPYPLPTSQTVDRTEGWAYLECGSACL